MLVDTFSVKLSPPPPPHCNWAVPPAFRKAPPALVAASKNGPTNLVVAVTVVPLTVFAVVLPIVGGADKSNVPPKVKLPVLVTVPDKLMPDTVPVPLTDVTVPTVGVAQVGMPLAKVSTWPFAPTASMAVVPAAD